MTNHQVCSILAFNELSMKRKRQFWGQHFLKDDQIASRIVESLSEMHTYNMLFEVGPGKGILTRLLLKRKEFKTYIVEIDNNLAGFLIQQFPEAKENLIIGDFLKLDFKSYLDEPFAIIGNFPYSISSQIIFKALDYRQNVKEVVGMFQREVAKRIVATPGSKAYGIISVFAQAFYDTEYLFEVDEESFAPPPKVKSAVIKLIRNDVDQLGCDESLFSVVVKAAFHTRRKTLRNALKGLFPHVREMDNGMLTLRAEQLSISEFIELTNWIESIAKNG